MFTPLTRTYESGFTRFVTDSVGVLDNSADPEVVELFAQMTSGTIGTTNWPLFAVLCCVLVVCLTTTWTNGCVLRRRIHGCRITPVRSSMKQWLSLTPVHVPCLSVPACAFWFVNVSSPRLMQVPSVSTTLPTEQSNRSRNGCVRKMGLWIWFSR